MRTATTRIAFVRHLRHVEGNREGEDRVGDRDQGRDEDGAQDDRPVDGFIEERFEVFEAEALLELAADRVDRPEGGDQQDRERAQVADDQPPDRPGQEGADLQARTAVEEVGEPAARRPPHHDRHQRP